MIEQPFLPIRNHEDPGFFRLFRRRAEESPAQPQTPRRLLRPAFFYGILIFLVIGVFAAVLIPIAAGQPPRGREVAGAAFWSMVFVYLVLRRRNVRKTFALLFSILAFVVIVPLIGLVDVVINRDRYALNREFANNPTGATIKENNPKIYKTIFELDETKFAINGVDIPLPARIQNFTTALGKPSRIEKLQFGIVYVYDSFGITYQTGYDSDVVNDISFYCKDMSSVWSFSPHEQFSNSFMVAGKSFPFGKPIAKVMQIMPGISKNPRLDFIYTAALGKRELSIYVDSGTGRIQTITVRLQ